MSGEVKGLGFQLDKVTTCNTQRGGCGQEIRWGEMFGKRHPFNLDGTSHFDSCPNADRFRGGLRTLGDRDTFYRARWRADQKWWALDTFDVSRFRRVDCPASVIGEVADALCALGGPYQLWTPAEVRECEFFVGAGAEASGQIGVVFVRASFYRDLVFRFGVESEQFQAVGIGRYVIVAQV